MHTPVFFKEIIKSLEVKKGGRYIDATFGEGGHSYGILKKGGRVLAIDWDEEKIKNPPHNFNEKITGKENLRNFKLEWGNFKNLERIAKKNNFYPVEGVLFDLGISMNQIENSNRGFSFKKENELLDMRISKSLKLTAADIINSYSNQELYEIFVKNSEEINSWSIAQAIVSARRLKKIETVGQLVKILKNFGNKESTLRRIFQALRIAVNDEINNLKKGLEGAIRLINKKRGLVIVITFHSLEDRVVKNFIKKNNLKLKDKFKRQNLRRKNYERTANLRIFGF